LKDLIGTRWLERDNRFQRYIEVIGLTSGATPRVHIRTLSFNGIANTSKRTSYVDQQRFYKAFMASPFS